VRGIEAFQLKPSYKVSLEAHVPGGKKSFPLSWRVPKDKEVIDVRNNRKGRKNTSDSAEDNADKVVWRASLPNAGVVAVEVQEKTETILPPFGLNRVALLETGSEAMGMSPKQVMNIAEKLYIAGFISYSRTETTPYNLDGFDVRSTLREHTKHEAWGRSAAYLLGAKYMKSRRPPLHGRYVGDHPPITPLKAANRGEVGGGAAWWVHEYVVRNFQGSLHNELSFTRRVVASLGLEGETS
jgi:DNA topoisomerase IA